MSDKIEEIRARHEAGPIGMLPMQALAVAEDDRAFLLAEVYRHRADLALEKSRIVFQRGEIEKQRAENEKLREENERLRAEIDGLEAELALMKSGFDVAYRMLGDKP